MAKDREGFGAGPGGFDSVGGKETKSVGAGASAPSWSGASKSSGSGGRATAAGGLRGLGNIGAAERTGRPANKEQQRQGSLGISRTVEKQTGKSLSEISTDLAQRARNFGADIDKRRVSTMRRTEEAKQKAFKPSKRPASLDRLLNKVSTLTPTRPRVGHYKEIFPKDSDFLGLKMSEYMMEQKLGSDIPAPYPKPSKKMQDWSLRNEQKGAAGAFKPSPYSSRSVTPRIR